jgi:hypothetical protein
VQGIKKLLIRERQIAANAEQESDHTPRSENPQYFVNKG